MATHSSTGATRAKALEGLLTQLPFPEDSGQYATYEETVKRIVKGPDEGKYLAACTYTLSSDAAATKPAKGGGAIVSDFERGIKTGSWY